MGENYPFTYSASALFCITASIEATIYTIITDSNWSDWKLGWNLRLLSVVYTVNTVLIPFNSVSINFHWVSAC